MVLHRQRWWQIPVIQAFTATTDWQRVGFSFSRLVGGISGMVSTSLIQFLAGPRAGGFSFRSMTQSLIRNLSARGRRRLPATR